LCNERRAWAPSMASGVPHFVVKRDGTPWNRFMTKGSFSGAAGFDILSRFEFVSFGAGIFPGMTRLLISGYVSSPVLFTMNSLLITFVMLPSGGRKAIPDPSGGRGYDAMPKGPWKRQQQQRGVGQSDTKTML